MRQRSLASRTSVARGTPEGRFDSQNWTGSVSAAGHSASSQHSGSSGPSVVLAGLASGRPDTQGHGGRPG
ncbi:hypothetical protein FM21_20670 [Streptomyces mutabilis]|uniref:Uncharacterized protein n=1 Tax=Streptomyces mutabilis TaxID=67332 RepID=A0A086MWH2_9ACTN|nr:hypothetical protein FM21_20670 [Streptomyces mutabilis]